MTQMPPKVQTAQYEGQVNSQEEEDWNKKV